MPMIKFRGVRVNGNGYACGDLTHDISDRDSYVDGWLVKDVAQFAFTINGKDLYTAILLFLKAKIIKLVTVFVTGLLKSAVKSNFSRL